VLNIYDIIIAPFCIVLVWLFFSMRLKKYNQSTAKLFKNALKFKLFCALVFSLVAAFYYGGGDSEMFFYSLKDMRQAIAADDLSVIELIKTEKMDENTPLSFYFEQDNTKYPVYGFMRSSSNFLIPKLAVFPAILFFNSYLAICIVFAAFAFWGTIRLYKLFLHYFPAMHREVALATLFIPSACYWSAGFLKDSICFGSVGFLLYGLFNVFFRRKNQVGSLFWIAISVYFLYTIKVYILLALVPGIGFWLFGQLGAGVQNPSLKRVIIFFSLIVAGIAGYMLVNYLTSDVALSKFSLDNILETSNYSREMYERGGERSKGAYFQITTTNPALLVLNGLVATFFRPFPWEISSAIVLFSAIEALIFLVLIAFLFMKKGIIVPFRKIFDRPILILCFSFSIIFAISIGITATNFGSLSRYKIPCLPFFLMFILAAYWLTGLAYPGWMDKILNLVSKKTKAL
jgi:hypothetical protein